MVPAAENFFLNVIQKLTRLLSSRFLQLGHQFICGIMCRTCLPYCIWDAFPAQSLFEEGLTMSLFSCKSLGFMRNLRTHVVGELLNNLGPNLLLTKTVHNLPCKHRSVPRTGLRILAPTFSFGVVLLANKMHVPHNRLALRSYRPTLAKQLLAIRRTQTHGTAMTGLSRSARSSCPGGQQTA